MGGLQASEAERLILGLTPHTVSGVSVSSPCCSLLPNYLRWLKAGSRQVGTGKWIAQQQAVQRLNAQARLQQLSTATAQAAATLPSAGRLTRCQAAGSP